MAVIELDQKIEQAVNNWRESEYEGVSDITRRLLEFWFFEDHFLSNGRQFKFWRCQKEAMEHLIYIYEACKYHSLYDLSKGFQVSIPVDPTRDLWTKYCFKMATGSGKTFVMAMVIIWQYFNKFFETANGIRYSSHFLMLSPNIIVLDRLSQDFKDNKIFHDYPFIPQEWQANFDFQTILQSNPETSHSKGILHLSNIQQLYERREEEENPISQSLGPKPKIEEVATYERLTSRLTQYDDLLVMNDEAHHVHSDDLEWNRAIEKINAGLTNNYDQPIVVQLDFSATPKDLNGNLFPHIIYDYPLAEAIKDKIVKRPRIGEIENIPETLTKDFVKRNWVQINTGVEILKEFQKEFKGTDKKPVLFIMTDNTKNADKVGTYLERIGFQNKVLVIHTDTKGVITKKNLQIARQAARKIDSSENPYEITISVMMLKEGWDVKNVCVIVPLRAYDSPLLPEQTLGRGLRRTFPDNPDFEERLIVIDHPRFRQLWQAEIEKGELIADFTPVREAYKPSNRIFVDPKKKKYDFEVPVIEGGEMRTSPDISKLNIENLPKSQFKISEIKLPEIMYREKDLLEQRITREKVISFDYTENIEIYLSFITKAILSKVRASYLFSQLLPRIQEYIEKFLFDKGIDLEDLQTVRKLNYIPIREKIFEIFTSEINKLWQMKEIPATVKCYKLSKISLFHTSEPVYEANKTVFNALPYPKRAGKLEKDFMMYLDNQKEIASFTKILPQFPFRIPYYNEGFLRYYIPDFIAKTTGKNSFYLIETKGMKEEELRSKVKNAVDWCETVSNLIKEKWQYMRVLKEDFERYKTQDFKTLATATVQSV